MDTAISDFGAGGRGDQYSRYILQGDSPIDATVLIGHIGNDPTHRQDTREISPSGGSLSDRLQYIMYLSTARGSSLAVNDRTMNVRVTSDIPITP